MGMLDKLDIDAATVADQLVKWIVQRVQEAGAEGCVFGLSGGIDSAVVAGLCKRALPDQILGVIMPCDSHGDDEEDALLLAEALDIPTKRVDLTRVWSGMKDQLDAEEQEDSPIDKLSLAHANLKPRLRMTTLYYFANRRNYLVCGTGNRSEMTVGYFTKYGDGGADILPLAGLVKTQVRQVAQVLGVPERLITKAPSAGLWAGQTDENEMGFTYDELDRYIVTGEAPADLAARIDALNHRSAHKKAMPPAPMLP